MITPYRRHTKECLNGKDGESGLLKKKIKGKPLSPRAMAIAQYSGLAFLAAVVLYVTYHDIFRFVHL